MYLIYSLSRFASEITLTHSPDFLLSLSVVLSSTTCFTRIISTNTLSDMISSLAVCSYFSMYTPCSELSLCSSSFGQLFFSVSLPFSLFVVFCRPSCYVHTYVHTVHVLIIIHYYYYYYYCFIIIILGPCPALAGLIVLYGFYYCPMHMCF